MDACESWVRADVKTLSKLYNCTFKTLLGVRCSTCNDVCYVQSGYLFLKYLDQSKQQTKCGRRNPYYYNDGPLSFADLYKYSDRRVSKKRFINIFSRKILI